MPLCDAGAQAQALVSGHMSAGFKCASASFKFQSASAGFRFDFVELKVQVPSFKFAYAELKVQSASASFKFYSKI